MRRPTFVEGTGVTLADGQTWSFPVREPGRADPEYDALLRLAVEAEDEAERLRSELALTIFVLARNYELTPDAYRALLEYPPGDPILEEMQRAVDAFALEQIRNLPPSSLAPRDLRSGLATAVPHWNMLAWLRARWSIWLD